MHNMGQCSEIKDYSVTKYFQVLIWSPQYTEDYKLGVVCFINTILLRNENYYTQHFSSTVKKNSRSDNTSDRFGY